MHSKSLKNPDIPSIAFFDTYCVQSTMLGCCLKTEKKYKTVLIFQLTDLLVSMNQDILATHPHKKRPFVKNDDNC